MFNKKYKRHCIATVVFILILVAVLFIRLNLAANDKIEVEPITEATVEPTESTEETTAEPTESEEDKFMAIVAEEVLGIEYNADYKNDEYVLCGEIDFLEDYKARLEQLSKTAPDGCKNEAHQIIIPELENVVNVLEQYYTDKAYILIWKQRAAEYPVATEVWLFMKDQGWSDAVCAGILGNMMTECGGHTLDLQWNLFDSSGWFYGLCQWHKGYYPEVQGQSLDYQLQHLAGTMEQEFGMFGSNALDRFLAMTDPGTAAVDFAKKYERCAATEWNYVSRENNAWVAYRYFSN